jgi:hypothetical protein
LVPDSNLGLRAEYLGSRDLGVDEVFAIDGPELAELLE